MSLDRNPINSDLELNFNLDSPPDLLKLDYENFLFDEIPEVKIEPHEEFVNLNLNLPWVLKNTDDEKHPREPMQNSLANTSKKSIYQISQHLKNKLIMFTDDHVDQDDIDEKKHNLIHGLITLEAFSNLDQCGQFIQDLILINEK